MELLKVGKDKRALKFVKKRVSLLAAFKIEMLVIDVPQSRILKFFY